PEIRPLSLSGEEKADLEAFLRSLTSPALAAALPAPTAVAGSAPETGPSSPAGTARAQAPLADPEGAADAEIVRREAEDALEKAPADPAALRALLVAVTRLRNADLL